MTLVERFTSSLAGLALDAGPALVAVSGGPDSRALLDLLSRTRDRHRLPLIVVHVDHGMHPESPAVARQVEGTARDLGLECLTRRLDLGPEATETKAREARLAAFESCRREAGARYVMLGHTRDDQVETVLMRCLHGSGPAGLAGMQPRRDALVRPLLPFRRTELVRYLRERELEWWDDPANEDPRHLRSWIRGELLPRLEERIPDLGERLAGMADQARRHTQAWDAALDILPGLEWWAEDGGVSVAAATLAGYDTDLAETVLQALARRAGNPSLGRKHAGRVLELAQRGQSGRVVELPGGWRAELAFGRIRVLRVQASGVPEPLTVDATPGAGGSSWGDWRVSWRREQAPGRQSREAGPAWFVPGPLVVRQGRAGDRIFPLGGVGHRSVARCLQEAKVPLSRRESWPVVEAEGRVVWIPGVCRSRDRVPAEGSEALRVDVADS